MDVQESVPMDWTTTRKHGNHDIESTAKKIRGVIAPTDVFNSSVMCVDVSTKQNRYIEKKHPHIGDDVDASYILLELAIDYLDRPYCQLCYQEKPSYVVEHAHDLESVGFTRKIYAGTYRSKACNRCNNLESKCKHMTKQEKLDYWQKMNRWSDYECNEFFFPNLKRLGYIFE